MTGMVEGLERLASRLREEWARLRAEAGRAARELARQGLLEAIECGRRVDGFTGVDGWMAKLIDTRSGAVYAVRAARVESSGGVSVEEDVVYASGVEDEVKEYAGFYMMRLEVRQAARAESTLVVLDGPLVDPPFEPRGAPARKAFTRYHEERASIFAGLAAKGVKVIGFTKHAGGLNLLATAAGWREGLLADGELAYLILSSWLEETGACAVAVGPFRPPPAKPYTYYRGLTIAYVLTRWWDRAARIEAVGVGAIEASKLAVALTPPGLPAPVPVMLAHRASYVPRSSVRALAQKLVSMLPTLHPSLP